MKKLVWTALVALTTSTAVTLIVRALRYGWRHVLHEEPPGRPWLARKLVESPLRHAVRNRVEPHAPA